MSRTFNHAAWIGAAAALIVAPAFAQQPPDSVASDGYNNTAMGANALLKQTVGMNQAHDNTAAGASTLNFDTTGAENTAVGSNALTFNSTGTGNTAAGYGALYLNSTGGQNSAYGVGALNLNTEGQDNTATGYYALGSNQGGSSNTASGDFALFNNAQGSSNTAMGSGALLGATASDNTAVGFNGLVSDTTGNNNTAVGTGALGANQSGSNNIALGSNAGSAIVESNNIDIGHAGLATDNGVIRIGTGSAQKSLFVAGVATRKITGSAVYVTAAGELGVLASSERYKTAIAPMADETDRLQRLRPVTFHLKNEPDGATQYGLIAEEVEKIYPELVIHDEAGRIEGVRYDELAPMLLSQVQKLQGDIAELKSQNQVMQAALSKVLTPGN